MKPITITDDGFSEVGFTELHFQRLTMECGGSAANSTIFSNPTFEDDEFTMSEDNDYGDNGEGEENKTDNDNGNPDEKKNDSAGQQVDNLKNDVNATKNHAIGTVKSAFHSAKDGMKILASSAKQGAIMAKSLGHKAANFANSSFAVLDNAKTSVVQHNTNRIVNQAMHNPNELLDDTVTFIGKAGKGAGMAALSVACLPAGIAAFALNAKAQKKDKEKAVEKLRNAITRIDNALNEGGSDLSPDAKADLMITRRQCEQGLMKLKYGLDMYGK